MQNNCVSATDATSECTTGPPYVTPDPFLVRGLGLGTRLTSPWLSSSREIKNTRLSPHAQVISTTNAATRRGHIWCDVKLRRRHTSRDERAQALCANFVLQVTNTPGLGTRLRVWNATALNRQLPSFLIRFTVQKL